MGICMSVNKTVSQGHDVNAIEFQRRLDKTYGTDAVKRGLEVLNRQSARIYNRVMGEIFQTSGVLTPEDQRALEAAIPKRQVAQLQPASPPASPNSAGASSSGTATPESAQKKERAQKQLPFGTTPTAFTQAEQKKKKQQQQQ
jgi:hypothetical protein